MKDLQVQNISSPTLGNVATKKARTHDPLSDFKSVLTNSVEEVNKLLGQADQNAQRSEERRVGKV